MEIWLDFAGGVIGSIAWPLCAVAIALMFRKNLSRLFDRLKGFSGPGVAADFSGELDAIGDDIAAAAPRALEPDSPPSLAAETALIAETSPAAAIPHAWAKIEQALRDKARQVDPEANLFLANRLAARLREQGRLSPETARALERMRKLRNETAYGETAASFLQAVEYGRTAELLIGIINAIPAEG